MSEIYLVKQQGYISNNSELPDRVLVRWEDGIQETVHRDGAVEEFFALPVGQHFEATVGRYERDLAIHRIVSVKRVENPKLMTKEEFSALIDSLPTTESLPDTDWE